MKDENSKKLNDDPKLYGCSTEKERNHHISNFQRYCEENPGAVECKIFEL